MPSWICEICALNNLIQYSLFIDSYMFFWSCKGIKKWMIPWNYFVNVLFHKDYCVSKLGFIMNNSKGLSFYGLCCVFLKGAAAGKPLMYP